MITEEQWREIILCYYKETEQNVSKYLQSKAIAQYRDKFDKRFKRSGLKDLKKQNESDRKAATTYDGWIKDEATRASTADSKPKFTENQWREFVLVYYRTEKKSVSKFLEEMGINQRDKFNKRWKDSGLKALKGKGISFEDATTQYDFWFKQWKGGNFLKSWQQFQILEDTEDADIIEDERTPSCIDFNTGNKSDENNNGSDNDDDDDDDDTRSVLGDICNNKRETKLSDRKMSETIAEFYTCKDGLQKLLTFIKRKDLLSHKKAITRHWKLSGLAEMKERSESIVAAMEKYNDWISLEKSKASVLNKANASVLKAIPENLEVFMTSLIRQLALCGQGLGRKAVSEVLTRALKDWNNNSDRLFSTRTLKRYLNNYDLECRSVKNIDPARIAQVTPNNRDAFFFRLDQVVALIHSIDPISCPWTKWEDVDRRNIDNMDEMGTDSTRFREMLVIPKDVKQRLFQSTPEGDRANTHISLCVFSKSNGHYKDDIAGIEGAAMPLIIHSKSSSKNKDGTNALEKRMRLYNPEEYINVPSAFSEGITFENPLGLTIRTSNNGSMTKEIFLDAMLHYVKSLGADQGQNGKYVFLLLDSHVSRWNPIALYTLFKNRVVPIFFPSHLSIVVQPQDNGVILFLHRCIEEASMLKRLFADETSVAHVNRILEAAFHLFRNGERKKLMDHGSNSTTRAYRIPGIMPRDPFSSGWRENLELYASFNGLRIDGRNAAPYYGVRPKDNLLCPAFSDEEILLLDEAVPILARGNSAGIDTILDDPKAKCYSIANEIINNWVEKSSDERTVCPRATNVVERIALKHMKITHILTAEPKSADSMLIDENFNESKRKAILELTLPMETIEARPNDIDDDDWFKVTKMTQPAHMWHAFDGERTYRVSTVQLDEEWIINLDFDMFSNDKELRDKRIRSYRRRREEKNDLLHQMARTVAEEEREAILKLQFDEFMSRPMDKQAFANFKHDIIPTIERPSNHTVSIEFESEDHMIEVSAHGNGTSSMSQLVMDNICKTLVSVTNRNEKRKTRRGNKVNKTRRGSDGIVKIAQIDEQHRLDCLQQGEDEKKTKKREILRCKIRLRELRKFATSPKYQDVWYDDSSLDVTTTHLTKPNMVSLLKVFDVEGRTKISKGTKESIRTVLEKIKITQYSIEKMEETLLEELRQLGEEDDFRVDQSFGDSSYDSSFFHDDSISDEIDIGDLIQSDNSATNEASGCCSEDIEFDAENRIVSFDNALQICEIPLHDSSLSLSSSTQSVAPTRTSSRRRTRNQTVPTKSPSPEEVLRPRRSNRQRPSRYR